MPCSSAAIWLVSYELPIVNLSQHDYLFYYALMPVLPTWEYDLFPKYTWNFYATIPWPDRKQLR